ncbi:MAG: hypothetical protein PWR20_1376 [Bacteroidales bacterium]|jgi:hypothetical protein|nr:hypothetical protein [Bacteroidales bacterium]MDN5329334.1 hypothetical protein [Bacteroidales bacterium]
MKKVLQVALFSVVVLCVKVDAQEFKGHLKWINNLFVPHPDTLVWFSDQTLENRLELKWDVVPWLRLVAQARNRFIYGDFVENIPNYASLISGTNEFVDLSFLWAEGRSFIGHTEFDRLFAQVNVSRFELTLGRQRVNWGIDLVWNPNDLFNTFSYLNLEYPECPGTDAVSMKIYTSSLSYVEAVYQPQKTADSSAYGIRYRGNFTHSDFQALAARMAGYDVLGGGLSSELGQFAIRSEVSYFRAHKSNEKSGWVATLSADRSLGSNSFVQFGVLFNAFGSSDIYEPFSLIEPQAQNPMMLSRGKINLFVGANTTMATLFTPSIALLGNPSDGSAVVIPGLSYSASDNLTLALTAMLLTGDRTDEYPNIGQLAYLKVQWNF